MFETTPPGLDRITQWRVLMNVGKPIDHAKLRINWRLAALVALLILVGLLGLGARGAQQEPVQKGRGGLAADQIGALEKSKNFWALSAPALYNFLQNFPDGVAAPARPQSPIIPERPTRPTPIEHPTMLLATFCLVLLLILWVNLKSRESYEKTLRGTGGRR